MTLKLELRGNQVRGSFKYGVKLNNKMGFFTPLKKFDLKIWVMFLAGIALFILFIIEFIRGFILK